MFLNILLFGSLLGLGVGLLFYAYQKIVQGEKKLVPSLFILKRASFSIKKAKKRIFPPRFWIELLVVALLAVFFIWPYLPPNQDSHLIIVDNSLSTAARPPNEKSRLEKIKEDISSYLEDTKGIYSIVDTASGEVSALKARGFYSDGDVKQGFISQSINEIIQQVVRSSTFSKVAIFTDKKIIGAENAFVKRNWSPLSNTYFLDDSSLSEKGLTVSIGYSGEGSNSATLRVFSWNPQGWQQLKYYPVRVQDGNITKVLVRIPVDKQGDGRALKFQLSDFLKLDAISEDNVRYQVFGEASNEKETVLVVSNKDSSKTKNISDSIKPLCGEISILDHAEYLEQEKLAEVVTDWRKKGVSFIFYRVPPPEIIIGPTLVVLPSSKSSYLTPAGKFDKVKIHSWSSQSTMTKYVKFPLLGDLDAIVFNEVSWGNNVLESDKGPVLINGVIEGQLLIVVGIEVFPINIIAPGPLDILAANMIRDVLTISEANKQTKKEIGEVECLSNEVDCKRSADEMIPGLYLRSLENGDKEMFSVNLRQIDESLSFDEETEEIDLKELGGGKPYIEEDSSVYFIWGAITMLLLDMAFISYLSNEVGWSIRARGES